MTFIFILRFTTDFGKKCCLEGGMKIKLWKSHCSNYQMSGSTTKASKWPVQSTEDSGQPGHRLIWVFVGRSGHFVGIVVLQLRWGRPSENMSYAICKQQGIDQPAYLRSKQSIDQPALPHSLISTFVVCCLNSMICILTISEVSRF